MNKLLIFVTFSDCYDFAAIHKFGGDNEYFELYILIVINYFSLGFGCKNALPNIYAKKFNECINYALKN
jgi:hypothetical protein